jgi:hypothetical protein
MSSRAIIRRQRPKAVEGPAATAMDRHSTRYNAGHSSAQASSMITITGAGDHDQPDWLITMTGIRSGVP